MKIGQVQSSSQNFGAVYKTGDAARYIERNLRGDKLKHVERLFSEQLSRKPDIYLDTVERSSVEVLTARVGRQEISENRFRGIVGVIEEAVKSVSRQKK